MQPIGHLSLLKIQLSTVSISCTTAFIVTLLYTDGCIINHFYTISAVLVNYTYTLGSGISPACPISCIGVTRESKYHLWYLNWTIPSQDYPGMCWGIKFQDSTSRAHYATSGVSIKKMPHTYLGHKKLRGSIVSRWPLVLGSIGTLVAI